MISHWLVRLLRLNGCTVIGSTVSHVGSATQLGDTLMESLGGVELAKL